MEPDTRKVPPPPPPSGPVYYYCMHANVAFSSVLLQINVAVQCLSTDFSSQKGVKVSIHYDQTLKLGILFAKYYSNRPKFDHIRSMESTYLTTHYIILNNIHHFPEKASI